MSYASLRIGKVSQSGETAAHNHNMRASLSKSETNVNKNLSYKNILALGRSDTVKAINEKIESLNLKTAVRKDANRAIEFVMSASPEYFYDFEKAGITRKDWNNITIKNLGEEKYWKKLEEIKKFTITENKEKWKNDILKFVESDKDLKDNLINLVFHDDEKTFHAHLIVTPVVNGKLTAKQFFTPEKSRKWQDNYAKATGLKRGISSDVKHQDKETYEIEQARKIGYKEGKKYGLKKGKEQGYKEGFAAGQEASKKIGAQLAGFGAGLIDEWHEPTQKALREKDKEIKVLQEKIDKVARDNERFQSQLLQAENKIEQINHSKNLMEKNLDDLQREIEKKNKIIDDLKASPIPQNQKKNKL